MKQPLNEEFRRMQKLAGLINESQLSETKLFADFSLESESDNSLESRFARSISEVAREYDYIDNIDIPGYFDVYEDGDDFYAGPTEALKLFQVLPNEFVVTNNMDDVDESFEITKTGPDSFTLLNKTDFVSAKLREMSPQEFTEFVKKIGEYDLWSNALKGIDPFNKVGDRMDILSTNTAEDTNRYFDALID